MNKNLCSPLWNLTIEKIRNCHLSLIKESVSTADWYVAFSDLLDAIVDERKNYIDFAMELSDLTKETGSDYDFKDIFEEYFDHLEENKAYDLVIESAEKLIKLFKWENTIPSEYMYRIGNAYLKQNKIDEAYEFGKKWLEKYPNDYYAVASNVFLFIEMNKIDEALALTKKYLKPDLVCNNKNDTLFMAAYRLYEVTNDSYAKRRVEEKIAEFNNLKI